MQHTVPCGAGGGGGSEKTVFTQEPKTFISHFISPFFLGGGGMGCASVWSTM